MVRRQKTTRVPVALPQMETAPESWLRNIRLSGFTLTALGLVVLSVIVLAPGLRILLEQQQQLQELRHSVDEQKNAVDDLEEEVARWGDPAYIEAQARDRLLYVYPGEFSYLVIDDGRTATTQDGAPISTTIQTTRVDWVQSVLASVVTAGLTDAPASDIGTTEAPGGTP